MQELASRSRPSPQGPKASTPRSSGDFRGSELGMLRWGLVLFMVKERPVGDWMRRQS